MLMLNHDNNISAISATCRLHKSAGGEGGGAFSSSGRVLRQNQKIKIKINQQHMILMIIKHGGAINGSSIVKPFTTDRRGLVRYKKET